MTITAGSTNSVEVRFSVLGKIEVDDDIDSLNVDTAGEEIGADKVSTNAVAEIMEDAITGLLLHPSMTIETGVAQFGDFFGEQFDTVGRVAEYDGLVDLKLGEESVQAVDLLLLLHKGIVLSDTAKGEFVHKVDFVRGDHVFIREVLDGQGESGGKQHDLAVLGVKLQELLDDGGEFNG